MTYMNDSGRSVQTAMAFFKVEPEEVVVIHDELDLPFGRLQLKAGGGTGGHNGLNSIRESWGEDAYGRLRFGIGKPQGPGAKERVIGHVLGDFAKDEWAALDEVVGRAADTAELWAREGMQKAMNAANRKA
jgi:PTH1 family peptidyl-tRNA hydrolase